MIKAILELYHITRNGKYLEFADAFIDYFVQEDGSIASYDPKEYNLDNVNAGKTLFDLYGAYRTGEVPQSHRHGIQPAERAAKNHNRQLLAQDDLSNQIWLDGLYMAQPFYMQYEVTYNNGANCEGLPLSSFFMYMTS